MLESNASMRVIWFGFVGGAEKHTATQEENQMDDESPRVGGGDVSDCVNRINAAVHSILSESALTFRERVAWTRKFQNLLLELHDDPAAEKSRPTRHSSATAGTANAKDSRNRAKRLRKLPRSMTPARNRLP